MTLPDFQLCIIDPSPSCSPGQLEEQAAESVTPTATAHCLYAASCRLVDDKRLHIL